VTDMLALICPQCGRTVAVKADVSGGRTRLLLWRLSAGLLKRIPPRCPICEQPMMPLDPRMQHRDDPRHKEPR
jgi:endogenous inhibitor of DNA gyrase (YacG/DUF329 family)